MLASDLLWQKTPDALAETIIKFSAWGILWVLASNEKIGFGSFLILDENEISFEEMKKNIKIKRFENTSSTKLELQTFLWALNEINDKDSII